MRKNRVIKPVRPDSSMYEEELQRLRVQQQQEQPIDNHNDDKDDGCPTCIQRKQEDEALQREMDMIAPPIIKDPEMRKKIKAVVPLERTEEEKKRDEDEKVKLEEYYRHLADEENPVKIREKKR